MVIQKDENKAEDESALCEICFHRISKFIRHVKTQYKKEFKPLKDVLYSHSYFCEGNGLAEVEENDSNDTPVCEDDPHKAVLCTRS